MISVVLASIDASRTIARSVQGFLDEVGDRGDIVVVDASRDDSARVAASISDRVRIVRAPVGRLAPELWRDGLTQTSSRLVAFSTAQMVPRSGWLDAMLAALDTTKAAGVGGPIAPGPCLSKTDRGLFLLRYASYLPPLTESPTFDPPGDNAIYRRDALKNLKSTWAEGFWEVEIHRALRACGERLVSSNQAAVEYLGGAKLGSSLAHRVAHARRFGAGRAVNQSWSARMARVVGAPVIPAVLMGRIARRLRERNEPLRPWLPAVPHLALIVGAWSMGEAAGSLWGHPQRERPAA